MKVVISPDSFKGTLTALEAAQAIEQGIKQANSEVETVLLPVADGGEGTMDALVLATNGHINKATVLDPLGREIEASFGVLGNQSTCVIEMASASGITLLDPDERNPRIASSFGTGQLIRTALDQGYRDFIICIGGSATNDAGVGMLRALGLRLLDQNGRDVQKSIDGLYEVKSLDFSGWDTRLKDSKVAIACDVDNPLVGEYGATAVFGPQKGVKADEIAYFDQAQTLWANVVEAEKGIRLHDYQGAGAAGGMGGALIAFLQGKFHQGIHLVLDVMKYREKVQGARVIITGEGKSDRQTLHGKAPIGVLHSAKELDIPTVLISGSIDEHDKKILAQHFEEVVSVVNDSITPDMAMREAAKYLSQRAYETFSKLVD
ncbi:glycerate kinase [Lysinibacillus composti]|uniref:Glycerate kinase n=1 Tax=Lysinibacillus composti TaxID=720633 RepID=A0A3N9UET0_9BACI|nr:glycerate kinase [Lysinibacillus composti]MBM7608794.1 glycerate kinase [Lysinibacillus composti]RQW74697.1 glycerate kinase [Lysinibacillus composti]